MTDLLFKPDGSPALPPIDPNVSAPDMNRFAGQNLLILERLQQGPATNGELAAIALKYTSRITDLRDAGYEIECERRERGVNLYTLKTPVERSHNDVQEEQQSNARSPMLFQESVCRRRGMSPWN